MNAKWTKSDQIYILNLYAPLVLMVIKSDDQGWAEADFTVLAFQLDKLVCRHSVK